MKKLVVVAAVALIAGLANAASVNWTNPSTARITGLDGANISAANAKAWFEKVERGESPNPYEFEHSNEPDWYNAF